MIEIQSFSFGVFQENTYVVFDPKSKQALLFDPGFSDQAEEGILVDFIAQHQLCISDILLTHAHIDHVLGLHKSTTHWNCVPILHQNERSIFEMSQTAAHAYQIPYQAYTGNFRWIDNATLSLQTSLGNIQLLHTPGHSPGSICFYFSQQGIVIGGDVLFHNSIGRSDLPGGNFDTLIHSIKTHLFALPDDTKVYPGHGTPTQIGYEKMNNPFLLTP